MTPELRRKLKSPFGLLIRGSPDETMVNLKKLIEEKKPTKIISVGDVVSDNMMKRGILPNVFVVDNKAMRKPIASISLTAGYTAHLRNPPGTLSDEAWSIMREAIGRERQTVVIVDGEEDLLTLVAVECAPERSFVVYGQPQEGIVVIRVTEQEKAAARQIIEAMIVVSRN